MSIVLVRIRLLAVACLSLAAAQLHADLLSETDGIRLYGTVELAQANASKCRLVEDKYTEEEWEEMRHNVGQPLHLWKLKFTVENGSGKALDHLIAIYSIESEWPPCNYWDGIDGVAPQWADPSGFIQKTANPYSMAPGETATKEFHVVAFHTETPRFSTWSVSFNFAGEYGQDAARRAQGDMGGSATADSQRPSTAAKIDGPTPAVPDAQTDSEQPKNQQAEVSPKDCAQWNTEGFFRDAQASDVQACLNLGADPNATTENGEITPLMFVGYYGDAESARLLIEAGANVSAKDNRGYTALYAAAWSWGRQLRANEDGARTKECIDVLLEAGARSELVDRSDESLTIIHRAVSTDNADAVTGVLKLGANPNAVWEFIDTQTPLFMAESAAVVDILVEHGANVNWTSTGGNTPLHEAKNGDVAGALLRAGAAVNAPNYAGKTPLHSATGTSYKDVSIAEVLLKNGAYVHARDWVDGETPLTDAVLSQAVSVDADVSIVRALLRAGANVNESNNNGRTPLHYAVICYHDRSQNCLDVLDELVQAGADLNALFEQRTALHTAIDRANSQVVEFLIQAGADLGIVDEYGRSPLAFAQLYQEINIKLLREADDEDTRRNRLAQLSEYAKIIPMLEAAEKAAQPTH